MGGVEYELKETEAVDGDGEERGRRGGEEEGLEGSDVGEGEGDDADLDSLPVPDKDGDDIELTFESLSLTVRVSRSRFSERLF